MDDGKILREKNGNQRLIMQNASHYILFFFFVSFSFFLFVFFFTDLQQTDRHWAIVVMEHMRTSVIKPNRGEGISKSKGNCEK